MMKRNAYNRTRQGGMVSIMVTMIMMLVISLIVLGFAQVSRREQRQSLDRTLSTEAFYAAESGVNDVVHVIQYQLSKNVAPDLLQKTTCDNSGPYYGSLNSTVDSADNASYTCALVTMSSPTIDLDLTTDGTATGVPLKPTNGLIRTLQIKVTLAKSMTMSGCPGALPSLISGEFPKADSWSCQYGALRVDLVPTDTLDQATLMTASSQKAFYFYPVTGAGATPTFTSGSAAGNVYGMHCVLASCTANINLIGAGSTNYGMRVMTLYKDMSLEITGSGGAGATNFSGAQATIDVTGKAQDELRRIRVRISLESSNGAGGAIVSGSAICKRFGIAPGNFVIQPLVGQDTNNPMCKQTP